MILAAGRGERLRPLTDTVPKPLMEVGGERLIDRHLRRLAGAGVTLAVVNVSWLAERIVEHVGDGGRYGLDVVYSPEPEGALDTGGGIARALPLLGDAPFWVVNGDVYTDYEFGRPALPDAALGHVVLVPNPAHNRSGDFGFEDGRANRRRPLTHTLSGIGYYRPELMGEHETERFPLAPLLFRAAEEGRLSAEVYEGEWADVGTADRLEALRSFARS